MKFNDVKSLCGYHGTHDPSSHSNDKDVNFWKSQWGSEIWFSHGSEHSAGIYIFKQKTLFHSVL